MKWSMDTHKYISEITRKALQVMTEHNVTSESEPEEILAVEHALAEAGVYRDFASAEGRVRRALFTYFKAYGCMDDNEHLTELGRLYVENKLTVKEFSFRYIVDYEYKDTDTHVKYYPVQFLLTAIKKLSERGENNAFISAYDFSRIEECNDISEINDAFVDELIQARAGAPVEVNERTVGYDVWQKMLVQAGIFDRTTDRNLVVSNWDLANWLLSAYTQPITSVKGQLVSGVLQVLPIPDLIEPHGDAAAFSNEGKALQAYLFDAVDDNTIKKYIYSQDVPSFEDMLSALGLSVLNKGFYSAFVGLEHLIGYCLAANTDSNIKTIGAILSSVELTVSELTEIMPIAVTIDYDRGNRNEGGTNTLLYGVPGSGKSWTIEHEYCHRGSKVERLVFHPDYTNADFLGQILPVVDSEKQVTYEFTAGPFTSIMRDAYTNPLRDHVLIIEEVNRGNAPAIFGEIFQLLDRKASVEDGDNDLPVGTSEYGITHKYMADYIYGDENHKVRIPSNLSIIGTMNTSDQNVFTLDTAFQRRWNMRLIENNFDNVRRSLAEAQILDTEVTWQKFCETINDIIIGNKSKMASAEDKRLGVYFVHEKDLEIDHKADPADSAVGLKPEYDALLAKEREGTIAEGTEKERLQDIRDGLMQNRKFPEKVIKYLWDDAFKFTPEALFDTSEGRMDNLEKVIRTFIYSQGHDRFKVFKDAIRQKLYE